MDDLLREFLTETAENMAALDGELVKLEQNPNDPDLLSNIFRLFHTVKGTCGFLKLPRLETLAHAGENILSKFRSGELSITPHAVTLILRCLDGIKYLTAELEKNEREPAGNDTMLINQLEVMARGETHAPDPPPAPVEEIKPAESAIAAQSIRVNVDVLENLMITVSELVLTRNQLMQILRSDHESAFVAPLQRLNQITSELQEGVMKTRMQPIGTAWSKLPRIVRDLAVELGKKIDLKMKGADTELDRQVLELIKDPLTHMVRNSGDHGIEMPAERLKAGKSETGVIHLNAYHQGGSIIVEIRDDGRGLDIGKIKAKAHQNKLASEAELAAMSNQQIMQFIFHAGFSTAEHITPVSGRGVGMDVVRTNLEKIGGTVEIQSQPGKGSCFFIKIPLTLAIVPVLIVDCGVTRFAIPQMGVMELVQISAGGEQCIELIKDTPVLRLRNRLLPLVSLRTLLKLDNDGINADEQCTVVVVRVGHTNFGIIVDHVFDTEEIVIKPVTPLLRHISIYSGNTILGDGSVIMILDLNGIATQAGHMDMGEGETAPPSSVLANYERSGAQSMLLFRAGAGAPKAVPLSLVARLESVDRKTIEYSHGLPMVQYRGTLMPLVTIANDTKITTEGSQPLLVFTDRERNMGLVVDEIIDIVDDFFKVDLSTRRPGYLGTSVIAGKATDILDAAHYLAQAFHDWFGSGAGANGKRILLVDDSVFFRNLLTPYLTVAGYDVTAVEKPSDALKLQDAGADFDAIISDIEMPGMSGFEFGAVIKRAEGRWKNVPMLALSSRATQIDLDRGREAGFTDYIAKYNREALLTSLNRTLDTKARA